MFEPYLKRWALVPDGEAIHTYSSDLLPVVFGGRPAMLKVTRNDEEMTGNRLMVWLDGRAAARVYAHAGAAVVLERLSHQPSLEKMVQAGRDDEATRILCRVAADLHAVSRKETPLPELPTLRRWFRSLERTAAQGGLYATTWDIAEKLLNAPQQVSVLHGDIHHGNVLHRPHRQHGGREWLLIDPKGILGERTFDYANIFYNPTTTHAAKPGRLARQVRVVCEESRLDPARLLAWVAAYGGLSAAWWLEDGRQAEAGQVMEIVGMALSALNLP